MWCAYCNNGWMSTSTSTDSYREMSKPKRAWGFPVNIRRLLVGALARGTSARTGPGSRSPDCATPVTSSSVMRRPERPVSVGEHGSVYEEELATVPIAATGEQH